MFLFKVIKKLIYYFFSFLELFFLSKLVQLLLLFIFFISTFPLCLIRGNDRRRIFGTDPIINNILWSKSLKDKIDRSDSVVHFHDDSFIAKAKDYDYIIEFYFFKFPKLIIKKSYLYMLF